MKEKLNIEESQTIILSPREFRIVPGILYDILQELPDGQVVYSWSVHDPFTFTCLQPFPTDIFLHRLRDQEIASEDIVMKGGENI